MASSDLRRIIPYVRPYKWQLLVMVCGALGGQLCALAIPIGIKHVIDTVLVDHHTASLTPLVTVVAIFGIFQGILLGLRRYVLARSSSMMEMKLRGDLFAHLQRLSLDTHAQWQTGQLLSRAMSDSNIIFREFISWGVVYFITNIVTFVVAAILLVHLSPLLTLVVALPLIPVVWTTRRFKMRYRAASRVTQDRRGDLGTAIEEAALGQRVITAFGRQKMVLRDFEAQADVAREAAIAGARIVGRFRSLLDFVPNLMLAAVMAIGGWSVADGRMTIGGLVAFFSLLVVLAFPVQMLGDIMMITHESASAAQRIFEVLDIAPAISERKNARPLNKPAGRVVLENVSFSYGDKRVLESLDLTIEPGETVAIAGRTGSGKTVLCTLLARLADPTSGAIFLDGQDLRDLTLMSLRHHVGMAFEDALLFSASVRENLLLGHPDATDDDIEQALALAQAGFVMDLPYGMETRIGEQGVNLSGGQRQRLALARAVIGKPTLLVMDDPLSALDVHTESLVEEALSRVLSKTTALISVHRPSTAALADRVAFLEDGRIVATGSHEQLLASVPSYNELLGEAEVAR